MKTIHKIVVAVDDVQQISVPEGAGFLSVQNQDEKICLWYTCDTERRTFSRRKVAIAGTGHRTDHCEGLNFLGTVQLARGALVFHVFVENG